MTLVLNSIGSSSTVGDVLWVFIIYTCNCMHLLVEFKK